VSKTYQEPNYSLDPPEVYKGKLDENAVAHNEITGQFAPHEAATPDMTVLIDAGRVLDDVTLTQIAQQTTAAFTAPVTNPRIDRIVIDESTGAYSVIAGTEAASPAAPAITAGKLPCCQVALAVSTTAITNTLITDERAIFKKPPAVPFRGCLISASDASSMVSSNLDVPFNTESYDTDSFHDNATNNTRITIPTGVTKVVFKGYVYVSGTGSNDLSLRKNGAEYTEPGTQLHHVAELSTSVGGVAMVTAVLEVTGGDYFELRLNTSAGGTNVSNVYKPWFSVEVVE